MSNTTLSANTKLNIAVNQLTRGSEMEVYFQGKWLKVTSVDWNAERGNFSFVIEIGWGEFKIVCFTADQISGSHIENGHLVIKQDKTEYRFQKYSRTPIDFTFYNA